MVPRCLSAPGSGVAGLLASCLLFAIPTPAPAHPDCSDEREVGEYVTPEETSRQVTRVIRIHASRPVGTYETPDSRTYVTREVPEYLSRFEVNEEGRYARPTHHGRGALLGATALQAYAYAGLALDTRAVEVAPGRAIAVRGKGSRRHVRYARLVTGFEGARRVVYEAHGFPRHRHRERGAGRTLDIWTYPEAHVRYVFCGERLLRREAY